MLITFTQGIDHRCRELKTPTVARLLVAGAQHRYIVIGTEYGYLHTTGGDVRTWRSYSGAYKAAKRYVGV